jgi:hypothetical protein
MIMQKKRKRMTSKWRQILKVKCTPNKKRRKATVENNKSRRRQMSRWAMLMTSREKKI